MPKKAPAKVGRPTLYDAKVHPQILRKLAEDGKTDEQMAGILGIAVSTFYEWKALYPEFAEAIKAGKQNPDDVVEDALYRRAKGFVYKEAGREKVALPDTKAITFWLKNRRPDKWRESEHITHEGHVGIEISERGRTLLDQLARQAGEQAAAGSPESASE